MNKQNIAKCNTMLLGAVSCFLLPLAQMTSLLSANTTCYLMFHQPEQPEAVKKLRKF